MILLALAAFSLLVHEWAHGWTAARLGDPLPRLLGRDRLDPAAHLSVVGSFAVPAGLVALGLPPVGWGQPVPFSSTRLGRRGALVVLASGPAANLVLAGVGAFVGWSDFLHVNIAIGVFNLLPLGTLDGRRILHVLRRSNA